MVTDLWGSMVSISPLRPTVKVPPALGSLAAASPAPPVAGAAAGAAQALIRTTSSANQAMTRFILCILFSPVAIKLLLKLRTTQPAPSQSVTGGPIASHGLARSRVVTKIGCCLLFAVPQGEGERMVRIG